MHACSVMSHSLQPCGLKLFRSLCPCNFPGKDTGVGYHFLLQGIFLSQGSNLHWQADSLPLTTGEALLCKCIHLYKIQYIYYVNKFIHLIYIKCLLLRAALLCCARELLQWMNQTLEGLSLRWTRQMNGQAVSIQCDKSSDGVNIENILYWLEDM